MYYVGTWALRECSSVLDPTLAIGSVICQYRPCVLKHLRLLSAKKARYMDHKYGRLTAKGPEELEWSLVFLPQGFSSLAKDVAEYTRVPAPRNVVQNG